MIEICEQQFIGSGGFANVYKVKMANQVYALKKIHPYLLKDPSIKCAIMKQIDIMKQVDHPNIVKFHSCIQSNQYQVNLVLEFVQGGNLYNQLKIHESFSQQKTIKYVKDILKALKYLHSRPNPILHRDIKPENILISKSGQCKLADFGSSNLLDGQRNTFAGTQQYMAPQIIQNKPYGKQVDLWCIGVLIHELLLGQIPKQQDSFNFPNKLSRAAQDVIKRLLHKNPVKRMTLQELQNHIWLAQQSECLPILSMKTKQQQIRDEKQEKSVKQRIRNLSSTINQNRLKELKQIKKSYVEQKDANRSQLLLKNTYGQMAQIAQKQKKVNYISTIKLKCQLSKKFKINKQKLSKLINFPQLKQLKQQSLQSCLESIKQIQGSIYVLQRKNPLKFYYEYQNVIRNLIKKVDYFNQYIDYFPSKLIQQTTQIPTITNPSKYNIQIDNYIIKLKNFTLQAQRDTLIDLINAKNKYKTYQSSH